MKKVLVLVADYPNNNGGVSLMYVHTRNVYYANNGIDVCVLNFKAKEAYTYEGIRVISLDDYKNSKEKYDVLILHAANIRNHYAFLKKYGNEFERMMFFFHGHEVLRIRETYSKPYYYVRSKSFKDSVLQDLYDNLKLFLWRHYLPKISHKSQFVFVSGWMLKKFEKYVAIKREEIDYYIIANSIGKEFERNSYDSKCEKEFDFVTIRSNLDGSKYSIDLVNDIAKSNPEYNFLVIGKGTFFNYYDKAQNLTWWDKTVNHEEIIKILDMSRYALMPTRLDAQGVMMCEMASYGIPVITSKIDICEELQHVFDNMILMENDVPCDIKQVLSDNINRCKYEKNEAFYAMNTMGREIELINEGK